MRTYITILIFLLFYSSVKSQVIPKGCDEVIMDKEIIITIPKLSNSSVDSVVYHYIKRLDEKEKQEQSVNYVIGENDTLTIEISIKNNISPNFLSNYALNTYFFYGEEIESEFISNNGSMMLKMKFTDSAHFSFNIDGKGFISHYIKIDKRQTEMPDPLSISAVVYPNPVSDILTIDPKHEEELSIVLVNAEGKVFREWKSAGFERVDVSDLQKGFYILKITDLNGVSINRFQKI